MKSKLISEDAQRIYAVILEKDDEVLECLQRFAREENISGAGFTGLGAFSEVTLGFFDWQKKDYERIPVREQLEVVSLVGDIALGKDGPQLHPHIVVSKSDGSAMGGHLLGGTVRPTLEVIVTETPAHLRRVHDPETGLALIKL